MDVISLLNSASTTRERKATGDNSTPAQLPVRSRTPWDAGGYSLPLNPASQNETFTASESNNPFEEKRESTLTFPNSVKSNHRLSDSRSSVSSFTSTTSASQQSYHSRLSSISTVSSLYPLSVITDLEKNPNTSATPTPDQGNEVKPTIEGRDCSLSPSALGALQDASARMDPSGNQHHDSQLFMQDSKSIIPSPTDSLNALAMVAEHQLHDRQEVIPYHQEEQLNDDSKNQDSSLQQARSDLEMTEDFRGTEKVRRRLTRSASPSDAILIKRNAPMSMSSQTTPTDTTGLELPYGLLGRSADLQENSNFGTGLRSSSLQRMTHKRAFSAPDFAGMANANYHSDRNSMSLGVTTGLTPPPQHGTQEDIAAVDTRPASPPREAAEILNKPIVCMYIPDCDTGSQPRKAISHIFGRNKMCTRLIPNFVWVHFCRKHYQRSRYRNSKEYAKLQCDLVKKQIERLHIWSEENARKGEGAVVKDWGIAMRKREQKRLDEMSSRKEMQGFGPDAEGESDDGENPSGQGRAVPVTAVPPWLVSLCGNGYSTEKIAEIFDRLHGEILNDQIPVFPDIEILPNIIVDSEEPKSPKGYTKRRPIATAHKRSVSLGMSTRSDQHPSPRRMSQPVTWNPNGMYMDSPPIAQKRKRADGGYEDDYTFRPGSQLSRYRAMTQENIMRPRMTLAHRPVFSDIHEHEDLGGDQRHYDTYGQHMYPDPQMFDPYGRPTAPLPAPTPQRHPGLCTASQLDSGVSSPGQQQYTPYPQPRARGMHQRTQSDMSMFQQPFDSPGRSSMPQSVYYAPTIRNNPQQMNGMATPQFHNSQVLQQASYPRDHFSTANLYYNGPTATNHTRHQSTPIIPRQYDATDQYQYSRQGNMVTQSGVTRNVDDSQQNRMMYGVRH